MRLEANDQTAKALAAITFPEYTGRTFNLQIVKPDYVFSMYSSWDGGSRDYYAVVNLVTMQAIDVSDLVGGDYKGPASEASLKEGFAIVQHTIFCGKDLGITIFVLEQNAVKMIAPAVELSNVEKQVLYCTRSLKSSYAGISNYRQKESGLTLGVWTATQEILKGKGLLAKNGSITPAGRNAIEGVYSAPAL